MQPDGTNLCLGWLKWRDGVCCLHPGVQRWRFVIHEAHWRPASSDEVFSLTCRLRQELRKQLVFVNLHNHTTLTVTTAIRLSACRKRCAESFKKMGLPGGRLVPGRDLFHPRVCRSALMLNTHLHPGMRAWLASRRRLQSASFLSESH